MVDFLLQQYTAYDKHEKEYLAKNINNDDILSIQIGVQRERLKLYTMVHKINILILKLTPLFAFVLLLMFTQGYKWIFSIGILLVFLSEGIVNSFFPRKYYDKILINILVLEAIKKYNNTNAV